MTVKKPAKAPPPESNPADDHEVAACYSLRPEYSRHVPCFVCSCGKHVHGATWEEAGQAYDDHLDAAGVR